MSLAALRAITVIVYGKTRHMGYSVKTEFDTYLISSIYYRPNLRSSFRPIARLALKLQRFVCDCATPRLMKKLWSKGVAMHTYSISVYCA